MNSSAAGRFSSNVGWICSGGKMNPPAWGESGLSSMVHDGMAYSP
jgi:hypothetical protein